MKKIVIASMLALAAVGCQGNKTTKPISSASVTDLTPTPATPTYAAVATPIYTPTPVQPVMDTPAMSATPTATATKSESIRRSASLASGSYTVKKGDTLYAIARQRYGDGKQWQKIASANPGLTASSLKVGQTIKLP